MDKNDKKIIVVEDEAHLAKGLQSTWSGRVIGSLLLITVSRLWIFWGKRNLI